MSERITEDYVLDKLGVKIGDNPDCHVYDQGGSDGNDDIKKCLKDCGGKPAICELDDFATKGGTGKGMPEYAITFKGKPDLLIVVECKPKPSQHVSDDGAGIVKYNHPKDFACDGVLYYAKYLKAKFNVIAISVSGTTEATMRIDSFYWPKGLGGFVSLNLHVVEKVSDYLLIGEDRQAMAKDLTTEEVRQLARDMHEEMRNVGIQNNVRALFIADLLLALRDKDFRNDYKVKTTYGGLKDEIKAAVSRTLTSQTITQNKIDHIESTLDVILGTPSLKTTPFDKKGSLVWYINELYGKIFRMMGRNTSMDALGIFYSEFISFGGGDGNGLGIVLTPEHLCDFMAKLIQVNKNDFVIDTCCGSGSFLVSAMRLMIQDAKNDDEKISHIRHEQLYGIEYQDDLQTLAMTNMIIRNDGHSHIFKGDSFDYTVWDFIDKNLGGAKFTKGLINPPYSQKKSDKSDSGNNHSELEFVLNLLKHMAVGGELAVVCPMSCAIGTKYKDERRALMQEHTLEAVFSMPDDLFYPTGVNTCVMIWKAHKPHNPAIKTYFGYCKDDGFVKAKKKGRIDKFGKWDSIEKEWLDNYFDKNVIPGKSALQSVKDTDEWLAEAYMETDYSAIKISDFEQTVRDFYAYKVRSSKDGEK
jgi:type I restriction enzyme M protein